MPHFSVFGDTVNIAALMESTSDPMRIQMSHMTQVKHELDNDQAIIDQGKNTKLQFSSHFLIYLF